jgi:hypothetical protein
MVTSLTVAYYYFRGRGRLNPETDFSPVLGDANAMIPLGDHSPSLLRERFSAALGRMGPTPPNSAWGVVVVLVFFYRPFWSCSQPAACAKRSQGLRLANNGLPIFNQGSLGGHHPSREQVKKP